jgi:4-diphosphocytidyl-2-C-methyl-D-erythritol kinase
MISFPHAKINLGLSILSKRPDGFHDLETIFYPLPLRDVLEINTGRETRLVTAGLTLPESSDKNLILKAYGLLKKKYPQISPLEVHLYKSIPFGAGMGGGSSDAAAMLRIMTRFFSLPLSSDELFSYALELGSDCPFFLQDAPCLASGRGERLEPVSLDLSGYSFLLIHPQIKINTAWAYSKIKPARPVAPLTEVIHQPIGSWAATLHNDFERPVFEEFPFLKTIKEKLYSAGALFASMTGSGSTLYGIFSKGGLPDLQVDHATYSRIG